MRDLVYYVAASIDGFIADPHGDVSAFPQDRATLAALFDRYPETCPAHLRDVLGVIGAPRRFDTVLMGYRTYEPALAVGLPGGVYPHLHQVVVTHRDVPDSPNLTAISGDLPHQIARLKDQPGRDIWLCGGANLAAQLIDHIDEIQIKVNPVILGAGTPLLPVPGAARDLRLATMEELPGGVALLTYRSGNHRKEPARSAQ
ncbi:dihydrofolate reductase family protein [Corynebacterium variabile]|uniref:dihydrofolate reductase family protein n=1 Tax=Corynebacterium variabile TaxID=1727 RepID=UPI002FE085D3